MKTPFYQSSLNLSHLRGGTGLVVMLTLTIIVSQAFADDHARQIVLAEAMEEAEAEVDAVTRATDKSDKAVYRQKLSTAVEVLEPDEAAEAHNEIDSYVRFIPASSLASQPGKISVIKSAFEYSYDFKAFGQLPIEVGFGAGDININANDAVPVTLPGHLTTVSFGAETTLPFFKLEKTYLRLGITPSFYSDNWNFNANSFNFGSQAMVIYQPNRQLTFVAGLAVNPGFEDPFCPFGGVIYQPNDKLAFNLVPERPTISYDITDRITAFWEGGMSSGEFKVGKDGLNGAALQYEEFHTGMGFDIELNNYIDASVSFGRIFNQRFQYRDSIGKVNLKNNFYTEFRVEAKI